MNGSITILILRRVKVLIGKLSLVLLVIVSTSLAVANDQIETELRFDRDFVQGALITGRSSAKQMFVDGIEVELTNDGHFVFGFGRDAAPKIEIKTISPEGQVRSDVFDVLQREYRVQKIEGVESKYVSPPAEVTARIRSDNQAVKRARSLFKHEMRAYLEGFELPSKGPISGVYGSQRVFNGVPKRPHYGLDIAAPVGTPVYAPVGGVVTLAQDDMYYSGGTLILDHGRGVSSSFLHLSEIVVEEGERVDKGQLIAKIGKSGRVTGAHLDWRMNWKDKRLDPQLLLEDD